MESVLSGVSTTQNGNILNITIDVESNKELARDILQQIEDAEFEKDWNDPTNMTVDEVFDAIHEEIRELWRREK